MTANAQPLPASAQEALALRAAWTYPHIVERYLWWGDERWELRMELVFLPDTSDTIEDARRHFEAAGWQWEWIDKQAESLGARFYTVTLDYPGPPAYLVQIRKDIEDARSLAYSSAPAP